jgi:hypothetical protein
MRTALRRFLIVVVATHGLIHLLGAAKGLGWADVDQLTGPVSSLTGVAWLAAATLVFTAVAMMVLRLRCWWVVTAAAALGSQAVILTSWADAWAGSLANAIMLVAAGYGYAAGWPRSFRSQFRDQATAALSHTSVTGEIIEADLVSLPAPVRRYLRRCGAVGQPRTGGFHASVDGRIRSGPGKPWMRFTGQQVNRFGPDPKRLFLMDATMMGLPVDVFHTFSNHAATMRGRLCSLIPIVDASGQDMTRAETVTLFNDMCIMAPAALVDAPVTWEPVDGHLVRGTFTVGEHKVSADLMFNEDGDLVDFLSRDRLRAGPGGSFTRLPWSTPVGEYATLHGHRVATRGEALWHAPTPEGRFSYLEFHLDDIVYHPRPAEQILVKVHGRGVRESEGRD